MTESKYVVDKYQVDTGYCINCGLCIESCPFEALYFSHAFECARYRRSELVQSKDAMLETPERKVSGYFYPDKAEKLPLQTLLVEKVTEKR
jgi:formate hydrogenlyase subunit 6/NADH:ubiquinone oxidoreductase subunit I